MQTYNSGFGKMLRFKKQISFRFVLLSFVFIRSIRKISVPFFFENTTLYSSAYL